MKNSISSIALSMAMVVGAGLLAMPDVVEGHACLPVNSAGQGINHKDKGGHPCDSESPDRVHDVDGHTYFTGLDGFASSVVDVERERLIEILSDKNTACFPDPDRDGVKICGTISINVADICLDIPEHLICQTRRIEDCMRMYSNATCSIPTSTPGGDPIFTCNIGYEKNSDNMECVVLSSPPSMPMCVNDKTVGKICTNPNDSPDFTCTLNYHNQVSGTCVSCGAAGKPSCDNGNACQYGLEKINGRCVRPTDKICEDKGHVLRDGRCKINDDIFNDIGDIFDSFDDDWDDIDDRFEDLYKNIDIRVSDLLPEFDLPSLDDGPIVIMAMLTTAAAIHYYRGVGGNPRNFPPYFLSKPTGGDKEEKIKWDIQPFIRENNPSVKVKVTVFNKGMFSLDLQHTFYDL